MYEYLCDMRSPSHSGIMAGICKGMRWISQDKCAKKGLDAKLGITYSYCVGGCGIFGTVCEKDKSFFEEVFIQLRKAGIDDFEFSTETESIYDAVLSMFADKSISSETEYSFRIDKRIHDIVEAPEGYTYKRVDEALIHELEEWESEEEKHKQDMEYEGSYQRKSYEPKLYDNGMLLERLRESWYSTKDFLAQSCSYVVLFERKLVGVIIGSGRYDRYLAIDIEVAEECRRKGLAFGLAARFINDCLERDICPQWDCVESNIASRGMAEKLGFTLFKKRPYYWFDIVSK